MIDNIILFMIYSYGGATIEHLSYFFENKTPKALANPIITGFPIYGIGAYMIIWLNNILEKIGYRNIIVKIMMFAIVLTLFEYLIGLYVGAGPKSHSNGMISSWDYSDQPYNIKGIISLKHFIAWGLLGLILIWLHPQLKHKIRNGIYS
jgi:uncharacterized membrane protein